ncbi:hypothetical protein [Helicobacter cappadocius]|uniref:Uncharacterized protein n=1 Tax=Helicobacter cappadocius TaxID=3063998 RepID=A0AA90PJE6_9HELI|nr:MULTISPECIES: hypothetical protein [unclassified Helicobacter]MDO7252737.1 hypothetical protein [Helicobacter sp. faydin-H75]MDP2538605.1 hypothetical protein [Helicobacter sp. faydin-H76]
MKIHFIFIILGIFFGNLLADTTISEDEIIAKIPLKDNQVLLFDGRTQKAIGIIEVTQSGKIIRIPLPKKSNNNNAENIIAPTTKIDLNKKSDDTQDATPIKSTQQIPLINKNKQWDKKKIPYLMKEEIIPAE